MDSFPYPFFRGDKKAPRLRGFVNLWAANYCSAGTILLGMFFPNFLITLFT